MVAFMRPINRKARAVAVAVVALVLLFAWGMANLTPVMVKMAEARARYLAVIAINDAVREVMHSSIGYSDLVNVATDNNGQVTMLQANTLLMNDLATKAALIVQHNMEALENEGISLKLGSALGIPLLGGAGPSITVNVVLVGSVATRFVTAFETAGINQTRHQISMEASMLMRIVVPSGASPVTVTTYVPIAESIIVGDVPNSYVNVPTLQGMMNLVP